MLYFTIQTLVLLPYILYVGARLDNEGKYVIYVLLGVPIFFFALFEFCGKFGVLYDTVYCDENGIVIWTRKKTICLAWIDIKYIRAITSKGAIIGWNVMTWDGKEFDIFPPRRLRFNDYVKSIRPDVEVKT